MTADWAGSDLAAGDVAWRAWNRLGVSAWDQMFVGSPGPALLDGLGAAMVPELDRVTRLVLDELEEVRLYGEARERVVAHVQVAMVKHVVWAAVDAIRRELTRPDPVPFAPPPAGSWIRGRWAARPAGGRLAAQPPTWNGLWHRFAGDLKTYPFRINDVDGRTACGRRVTLRSGHAAAALADDMPGVDVCRRCRPVPGPSQPGRGRSFRAERATAASAARVRVRIPDRP